MWLVWITRLLPSLNDRCLLAACLAVVCLQVDEPAQAASNAQQQQPSSSVGNSPTSTGGEANVRLATRVYRTRLKDPVTPSEPPRTYDVTLARDENGFPAEYSLSFETEVCADELCKIVKVTMRWNAVGHFQRLSCPPDWPLTKDEHVPFSAEDYSKLDRILKDRDSILATWKLEFLERQEETGEDVDAVTGPTPATVQNAVIQDAAYTSWALWHWANGEIVPKIRDITRKHCTPEFLNHLLLSQDQSCSDFSLDYVAKHYPKDARFVDGAFHILENGERQQILRSFDFLAQAIADRRKRHARLIESLRRMNSIHRPMILQKLATEPDLPATTLEGLAGELKELPYFPLHLILKMLEDRKFASKKTITAAAELLASDDFFIARRAYEHLRRQELDADTADKVTAFGERHRDRL